MSLWVDKHRPVEFARLSFHPETSSVLKDLVPGSAQTASFTTVQQAANADFPHVLLYGPSGAGKMTRIRLLLQEVFDSSISKV